MRHSWSLLPLAALSFAQNLQFPLEEEEVFAPINPLSEKALSILGFGTWRLTNNTAEAVSWAIQAGYRHIDTATAYGNEKEVGDGIADGLAKTGLRRSDLWITTKLWNNRHVNLLPFVVEDALDESLAKLGTNYIDLYLMHWPVRDVFGVKDIEYRNTWSAMENLVDKGKARHIGVANFSPHQIKKLLKHYDHHPPQVHQMELHPYLNQSDFVKWHQDLGIHVTAYSSLGGTNPVYTPDDDAPTPLLETDTIKDIADDRGCTPAQVALMWGLTRGVSIIPKSSHKERIHENLYSLECILQQEDLDKIAELGEKRFRYNNPSESWGVPLYEGLEDSKGNHEKDS